jgi:hypothetical protein
MSQLNAYSITGDDIGSLYPLPCTHLQGFFATSRQYLCKYVLIAVYHLSGRIYISTRVQQLKRVPFVNLSLPANILSIFKRLLQKHQRTVSSGLTTGRSTLSSLMTAISPSHPISSRSSSHGQVHFSSRASLTEQAGLYCSFETSEPAWSFN